MPMAGGEVLGGPAMQGDPGGGEFLGIAWHRTGRSPKFLCVQNQMEFLTAGVSVVSTPLTRNNSRHGSEFDSGPSAK